MVLLVVVPLMIFLMFLSIKIEVIIILLLILYMIILYYYKLFKLFDPNHADIRLLGHDIVILRLMLQSCVLCNEGFINFCVNDVKIGDDGSCVFSYDDPVFVKFDCPSGNSSMCFDLMYKGILHILSESENRLIIQKILMINDDRGDDKAKDLKSDVVGSKSESRDKSNAGALVSLVESGSDLDDVKKSDEAKKSLRKSQKKSQKSQKKGLINPQKLDDKAKDSKPDVVVGSESESRDKSNAEALMASGSDLDDVKKPDKAKKSRRKAKKKAKKRANKSTEMDDKAKDSKPDVVVGSESESRDESNAEALMASGSDLAKLSLCRTDDAEVSWDYSECLEGCFAVLPSYCSSGSSSVKFIRITSEYEDLLEEKQFSSIVNELRVKNFTPLKFFRGH